MGDIETANGLLDELGTLAQSKGPVSLGDVVQRIGPRGFGPLLFLPAIIVVSPLGGIPGVPSLFALVIFMIAAQVLLGRRHIWLPSVLGNRQITADKLLRAIQKARPAARRMDRWLGRRLESLVTRLAKIFAALCVIALCLLVPPLEIIPFAAALPMLAIALVGLAFTARDGILMLVGLCLAGVALITGAGMLISG
ncbi:exopolysaccharide biosynthesis protein [Roseovarius sp. MMSF_3281]|uniref:exopolysaccharide biosynthesis protein n=1 Tax=Roseovarius sp. MMSF_3281 TaxID=3046694 RepID=UPI00273EB519|nr:exopolysaccharide biosynthesis protein [Roseovarius sp. MMSF_3281]